VCSSPRVCHDAPSCTRGRVEVHERWVHHRLIGRDPRPRLSAGTASRSDGLPTIDALAPPPSTLAALAYKDEKAATELTAVSSSSSARDGLLPASRAVSAADIIARPRPDFAPLHSHDRSVSTCCLPLPRRRRRCSIVAARRCMDAPDEAEAFARDVESADRLTKVIVCRQDASPC
jgi:hypothetical protein